MAAEKLNREGLWGTAELRHGLSGTEGGESSGDALYLLPDKSEEKQGSQNAIEWDVCDEVAHVVTDGPG